MYQVIDKKDFWHKNVASTERHMFGLIVFLGYLSVLMETIILAQFNNFMKNKLVTSYLDNYIKSNYANLDVSSTQLMFWAKDIWIAVILFTLIWTIILHLTKSRIMTTTMLILSLINLALCIPFSNTINSLIRACIGVVIYFPACMATYSFQHKWHIYKASMIYQDKVRTSQAASVIKKQSYTGSGFNPFMDSEAEPLSSASLDNSVSQPAKSSSLAAGTKVLSDYDGPSPYTADINPYTDSISAAETKETTKEAKDADSAYSAVNQQSAMVSSYAPADEATATVSDYAPADEATATVSDYAPADEVPATVPSYAPADEATATVPSYAPADEATATVSSYAPADETSATISGFVPADEAPAMVSSFAPADETPAMVSGFAPADEAPAMVPGFAPADETPAMVSSFVPDDETSATVFDYTSVHMKQNVPLSEDMLSQNNSSENNIPYIAEDDKKSEEESRSMGFSDKEIGSPLSQPDDNLYETALSADTTENDIDGNKDENQNHSGSIKTFSTIQPSFSDVSEVECVPAEPINFDDL